MARTKHVRSTSDVTRLFPTLNPPVEIGPGEVFRVDADLDLPETEPATAADFPGDTPAPVVTASPEVVDPVLPTSEAPAITTA